MGSRTYFWQYKALVWIKQGSSQRISSCACLASYVGYGANLYRSPGIIMSCP
ncbi:MAG: hypothetical protein ACMUEL_04350 [Flavobacteriales bacterium Tduv]